MGFILAKSPRQISLEKVRELTYKLPPFISRVAVVVNPGAKELEAIEKSNLFDYIQFHGSEKPEVIKATSLKSIKAISIAAKKDLTEIEKYRESADYFLFDTKIGSQSGGTGESFDWSLISELAIPYILAGGLGPHNIEEALRELNPTAVDLNSRVENEPGKKNHRLVKKTIEKIEQFQPKVRTKIKIKSN